MWELDYKESWALKNWCFWTVVLEKTPESPLDCKEIQPVHPKGNQSWIFIGWTDAEGEAPIFWPPDAKSWLIRQDLDSFLGGASGKEPACQCRRHKRCGFNPWVGKIPWKRAWQPTPVFLPGESHGQRSLAGYSPRIAKSWTWLSDWAPMLVKIEGRRRQGRQRTRWLDDITNSMGMSLSKLRETAKEGSLECCSPWGRKELDTTERRTNKKRDSHLKSFIPC